MFITYSLAINENYYFVSEYISNTLYEKIFIFIDNSLLSRKSG